MTLKDELSARRRRREAAIRLKVLCRQYVIQFQQRSQPRMLSGFEIALLNRLERVEGSR